MDERNVRLKVLNLLLHFHRHFLTRRDLPEVFDALEDSLEGVADILLQLFRVNCGEWIVHPTVIPLLPVRCCQPHVFERFKVLDQLAQLVILHSD